MFKPSLAIEFSGGDVLREQAIKFLSSIKDGSVVVDDELVTSRAGDIESKTVS